MSAPAGSNRGMFWRIVRRMLLAHPGRVLVILLALAAGAAITAALLNLQVDAKRRLNSEFRAFGANVMITPKSAPDSGPAATIPLAIFEAIPGENEGQQVSKAAFLFAVAPVEVWVTHVNSVEVPVVIAGYRFVGRDFHDIAAGTTVSEYPAVLELEHVGACEAGETAAEKLRIHVGDMVGIGKANLACRVLRIKRFGGPEDSQIFAPLWLVAALNEPAQTDRPPTTAEEGTERISLIQMSVPGSKQSIDSYIAALQERFPDVNVHAVRQFSEAQGKIYSKISGLLTATVVLLLVLTALCVMAAMTNVAMERRNDVGLMKAIGGATRRVVRLFLTEAALLGLVGGLIGAGLGILLSMELGKAVFGVAARPRFIVYPIAVGLTVLVALASSLPLRRLAGVRPAAVFRGEA